MAVAFDINNIPFDDPPTWDLICSGQTLGVFQCESRLVSTWLKRVKPRTLWELSAVIALVRPGSLESGMAEDYVYNKDHPDEIPTFGNGIVDSVFQSTQGVLVYQEGLMGLGNRLAWPHLEHIKRLIQVDKLRKAVGKKDAKKILEVGKDFVGGCTINGVSEEISSKLYDVIKKCGRYLFNLSHSFSYAEIAYKTAYLKANFPLEFFATYMTYAEFKQGEKFKDYLPQLINDCRCGGIEVTPPRVNAGNADFDISPDGNIRYGLAHIKFCKNVVREHLGAMPKIHHLAQIILLGCTDTLGFTFNKPVLTALISVGAFSDIKGWGRKDLLALYSIFNQLTKRELDWCQPRLDSLNTKEDVVSLLTTCSNEVCNVRRRTIVQSIISANSLNNFDDPAWVEEQELKYLQIPFTTAVENKELAEASCLECNGKFPLYAERTVHVILNEIVPTTTKKGNNPGQKMARIRVYDSSGVLENLPVFPDAYAEYEELLREKNQVALNLYMGKQGWVVRSLSKL